MFVGALGPSNIYGDIITLYGIVIVYTHGDFMVLSHRPLTPEPDIPLSHIILTLTEPVLVLCY